MPPSRRRRSAPSRYLETGEGPLAPPGGRGSPLAPPGDRGRPSRTAWRPGKLPLRYRLLPGGRGSPPCAALCSLVAGGGLRATHAPAAAGEEGPAHRQPRSVGGPSRRRWPAAGEGLRAPSAPAATPRAGPVPWRPALAGTRTFHGRIEAESGEGREEGGRKELRGRGGDGRWWIRLVGRGSEEIKMGGLSVVVDVCTGSFLGPLLI